VPQSKLYLFLYSLIDHQATRNRHNLLFLFTALAVGDSLWCVPSGLNVAEWERKIAKMEDTEYNEHALCEFKTYKAVEQGLASIVRCLEEESPAMRWTAAAHALALFPRRLDMLVPPLSNLLSRETCNVVHGTAVLSLAILFPPPG
jgi:ABC-type tungstate transport system substrate-binding protein